MAERNTKIETIVMHVSSFGEGHREALLLTKDAGLFRAAVFGGAKSKLKALVSPWQSGTAWIYTDPVKKTVKITDFDVFQWRQGIRESLVRTWCASFCSELVQKAHGNIDWVLVNAFLDGIAVSSDEECKIGLFRFIWRVLLSQGIAPDVLHCARCGTISENKVVWFSVEEDSCVCSACMYQGERLFKLTPPLLQWLSAIENLMPAQVRSIRLQESDINLLRPFLFFLTNRMVGSVLSCITTGDGIV